MQIVSGGVTDVGRLRTNNEDSFRILEDLNLFVLSDGMGGEAHGEVASSLAVETIVKYCSEPTEDPGVTLHGAETDNWSEKTKLLQNAVFQANFKIHDSAQKNAEQRGMGATVTAAGIIRFTSLQRSAVSNQRDCQQSLLIAAG